MLQSHRSRRILGGAALALAIVGGLACEGEGTKSDRDPADRQVDPIQKQTAVINASGDGPYSVVVRAAKVGDERGDYTRKSVAGGAYRQTLDYTSGLRITITITATGHRTDPLSCEITDGTTRVRDRAAGTVQCKLTTSR
ncbi:hypothetical protein O7622_01305 [Micromonospora sp. WMMD1076]|uniref:hypothetical protein n=1 Tax=Micromonospora sp. WMMD1076 TaxID=3016103 RepID=UPI00249B1ACD|nr:hypothetical protein [Micromonospora sp. WMMD1076]WFF07268.1 hypothetical protein O7622_01305 [Micromonospora sp. WMMD1076]